VSRARRRATAGTGQERASGSFCRALPAACGENPVRYRITKNREDAAQDSFLKALLHIEHFAGRSSVSTWLTSIAINSALMILRKRRKSPEIPREDSRDSGAVDWCQEIAAALRIRKSNSWRKSASDLCEG